jgi:hypothetical protein
LAPPFQSTSITSRGIRPQGPWLVRISRNIIIESHMLSVITAYSVEWVECSAVSAVMEGTLEGLEGLQRHLTPIQQLNPTGRRMLATATVAAVDMVAEAVNRPHRMENMARSWIQTTGDACFALAPFAKC